MTTKYKWKFTIAKSDVDEHTEARVRIHAERVGAEFLGLRKRRNGDVEFGVCADNKLCGKFKNLLAKFVSYSCEQFAMDGKPIGDGEAYSKPKPKPKARAKAKEETKPEPQDNERVAVIPPISGSFEKWSDLGSDEHKRALSIFGAGCEDPVMRQWGKFSLYRMSLVQYVYGKLKDGDGRAKFAETMQLYGSWAVPWCKIEPYAAKLFNKDDLAFVCWIATHSGRRVK